MRPPVPWHVEIAGPDVEPTFSGGVLVNNVVPRIPPERNCPPVGDHPTVQVFASLEADSNNTMVTVDVARLTANGRASNPVGQGQASLLSTTPVLTGWSYTELAALERVDAEKPNALAMNLDGVTVDNRGDADDLIFLGEYRRRRQQHENKNRAANAFLAHDFNSRPSARDRVR